MLTLAALSLCAAPKPVEAKVRNRSAHPDALIESRIEAWKQGHAAVGMQVVSLHAAQRTIDEGPTLTDVKFVLRGDDGQTSGGMLTLDGQGAVLLDGGKALASAAAEKRWSKRGKFSRALAAKVAIAAPDALLPVAMWNHAPYDAPDKEDPIAVWLEESKHKVAQQIQASASVERLVAVGVKKWHVSGPVIAFAATRAQLLALQFDPVVGALDLGVDKLEPAGLSTTWPATLNATSTGYDGTGVKVCLVEGAYPSWASSPPASNAYLSIEDVAGTSSSAATHCTQMAEIIAGDNGNVVGLAPDVWLYVYGIGDITGDNEWLNPDAGFSWCAGKKTNIWNFSQAHTGDNSSVVTQSALHRSMDYRALHEPFPTIVAAAGNKGMTSRIHNKLQNGLVVGSSFEGSGLSNSCGGGYCSNYTPTSSRTDDTLWVGSGSPPCYWYGNCCGSMWVNPDSDHDDWELPHIVAPGASADNCIATASTQTGATSAATAMVSGSVAQLFEAQSQLKVWPEAARAVMMAGAVGNLEGSELSLPSTSDQRDGSGLADVSRSLSIASNRVPTPSSGSPQTHGWHALILFLQGSNIWEYTGSTYRWITKYYIRRPTSGMMRVVIGLNAHPDCDEIENACPGSGLNPGNAPLAADLDIHIWRDSDSAHIADSTSYDNAYEFVRFEAEANVTYRVEVYRYAFDSSNPKTFFGLAWHAE